MLKRILLLVVLVWVGCSPISQETTSDCEKPQIYFAGGQTPFLCNGESASLRVELLDAAVANVQFLISYDRGRAVRAEGESAVWQYSNDAIDGETSFEAFAYNECGMVSRTFSLHNIQCNDTDDTDFPSVDYAGPRHVILFIGDGMGKNSEVAASRYLSGADDQLVFHQFPYANHVTTWDINTYNLYSYNIDGALYHPDTFDATRGYDPAIGGVVPVRGNQAADDYFLTVQLNWPGSTSTASAKIPATDSAASATALATGKKTAYQNISWLPGDPPNGEMKSITEYARAHGDIGVGVVSSVPVSHATPAAFVTHSINRAGTSAMAHSIIHTDQPDVAIGAGHPIFSDSNQYVTEEDWAFLQETDQWQFVQRQEGVDGAESLFAAADQAIVSDKKLFGMFGSGSFEDPIIDDAPGQPNVVPSTNENPTLGQAALAAVKVLGNKPDGFFLMVEGGVIDWANHQNNYHRMVAHMHDFNVAVQDVINWVNQDGDDTTMENTLIIVTSDHANGYITLNADKPLGAGNLPVVEFDGANVVFPDGEVHYGLNGHTNELVSVYATGAGIFGGPAPLFAPYEGLQYANLPIIDNTHIFKVMMGFFGIQED